MPPATSLVKQLTKQLQQQSKAADVLARVVALSDSDKPFLSPCGDAGFNTAWPADLPLDTEGFTEAFLGLVSAARGIDPRLQKRSDRLVPKKTDEPAFWRCYFGHLHAVLNGLEMTEATPGGGGAAASAGASEAEAELSAEERKTYEAAGLPPPRYA